MHENYAIDMHTHDFYELNIVCDGSGAHYIGGGRCAAERGCVFVIPPGVRHGYWRRVSLNVYHLLIRREFVARYAQELHLLPGYSALFEIEPYLRGRTDEELFLRLREEELAALAPMLTEMSALRQDEYGGAAILRDIQALRIIGALTREADCRTMRAATNAHALDVLHVMEYVRGNLSQPLSLDGLAKRYHLSRATLSRAFRAVACESVGAYVARCRLEQGMLLLNEGALSVTEIAQRCGYCDGSHFARQFSQATGLSPRSYQRALAAKV